MSNGANAANILTAVQILENLLLNAGSIVADIKAAQTSGTDITDDQINGYMSAYDSVAAGAAADMDAHPDAAGTAPAGTTTTPPAVGLPSGSSAPPMSE